jgi:hypothetical protein
MTEVTRRGFFATLAAVVAGVKAWGKGTVPTGGVHDDEWWGRYGVPRICEEHGYAGYPPCPVPGCPKGHTRDRYIVYRMAGFAKLEADYDRVSVGERREWVRDAPWMDGKRRICWREVGGRGTVFVAHKSLGRIERAELVSHD